MVRGMLVVSLLWAVPAVDAFSSALFEPALKRTVPSKHEGVDVELPDFDELFGRIQQVSPLARQVIQGGTGPSGLAFIDDSQAPHLKWQRVEANSRKLIHQIDKIDNFQGLPAPLIRFRASFEGPCYGDIFAAFKMDLEQRKRWDTQIKEVYEIYPLRDLDEANIAMGFGKFGDCQKIGIGYCKTKGMPAVGITPREQLTLCGVQQFIDGSTIIWGTEMEDSHNHLFPSGKRLTRSKTHLFSVTLTPSGPDTFDIEYAIQLEIGGNLPQWLTTPIMYDTIKRLFTVAQGAYRGKCDTLELFVKEKEARESSPLWHGLLMTP